MGDLSEYVEILKGEIENQKKKDKAKKVCVVNVVPTSRLFPPPLFFLFFACISSHFVSG